LISIQNEQYRMKNSAVPGIPAPVRSFLNIVNRRSNHQTGHERGFGAHFSK
jgi:hypothetical protein